jgi:hypothetical protein
MPSVLSRTSRQLNLTSEEKLVTLTARDETPESQVTFNVHKSILERSSDYFRVCLNSDFRERRDLSVDFEDTVSPETLGEYLELSYLFTIFGHESWSDEELRRDDGGIDQILGGGIEQAISLAYLLELSDRFLNKKMYRILRIRLGYALKKVRDSCVGLGDDGRRKDILEYFAAIRELLDSREEELRETIMQLFCEIVWERPKVWVDHGHSFSASFQQALLEKMLRIRLASRPL